MPIDYTPDRAPDGIPDGILDDEAIALGRQIYAAMRAEMEAGHRGRLVVIDTNTGDYEIGDYHGSPSDLEITKRLLLRRPDARTWAELVGGQYVFAHIPWRRAMESLAARHNELAHDSAAKAARDAAATCPHRGRMVQFDYTPEEAAELGRQIYAGMREELEANHWGRLVVIDIKNGDYEVGDYRDYRTDMELSTRLRERNPDALTWAVSIGGVHDLTVRLSWRQTMEWFGDLVKGTAHD